MGWLDAQGCGGAEALFAETATALGRRRELDGAAAAVTGKTEKEEERRRRRLGSYNVTQKLKEATTEPFPHQRDAKDGHDAPGTPKKVAGGVATAVNTIHSIYKFAIRQNSQITPKFS